MRSIRSFLVFSVIFACQKNWKTFSWSNFVSALNGTTLRCRNWASWRDRPCVTDINFVDKLKSPVTFKNRPRSIKRQRGDCHAVQCTQCTSDRFNTRIDLFCFLRFFVFLFLFSFLPAEIKGKKYKLVIWMSFLSRIHWRDHVTKSMV